MHATLSRAGSQCLQQARLANAWLAGDQSHPQAIGSCLLERAPKQL
jgi:hypothetical protein